MKTVARNRMPNTPNLPRQRWKPAMRLADVSTPLFLPSSKTTVPCNQALPVSNGCTYEKTPPNKPCFTPLTNWNKKTAGLAILHGADTSAAQTVTTRRLQVGPRCSYRAMGSSRAAGLCFRLQAVRLPNVPKNPDAHSAMCHPFRVGLQHLSICLCLLLCALEDDSKKPPDLFE